MSLREIGCADCGWTTTVLVDEDGVAHVAPLACPRCDGLELIVVTIDAPGEFISTSLPSEPTDTSSFA